MSGYYFVLTKYKSGRVGYSEARYETPEQAEGAAEYRRNKVGVRSVKVCHNIGEEIDVKQFV